MASGFALRRNGSCLATETECGKTGTPFHACCPPGSFCPHQYNVDCCPTAANCTQALLPDPQCANAEWDLFDQYGYFCCLRGLAGYATPRNTDGCAEAGYKFQEGEQLLKTISTATSTIAPVRSSTKSSSRSQPDSNTPAIYSSPASTAATAPKTEVTVVESVGATASQATSSSASIVGGSVGAVLAVALLVLAAWFLFVRRRRRRQPEDGHLEGACIAETDHASAVHEKDSRDHVLEMPAKIAHEKDSRSICELAAAGPPEMPALRFGR